MLCGQPLALGSILLREAGEVDRPVELLYVSKLWCATRSSLFLKSLYISTREYPSMLHRCRPVPDFSPGFETATRGQSQNLMWKWIRFMLMRKQRACTLCSTAGILHACMWRIFPTSCLNQARTCAVSSKVDPASRLPTIDWMAGKRIRPAWTSSPVALSKRASSLLVLWGLPVVMLLAYKNSV